MTTPESVLLLAEGAANSCFDEPEYVTTFGDASGKDPWDDDAVDKDSWVSKTINTFEEKLKTPSVECKPIDPPPQKLGKISKSLNLGRGYAEHWERNSCRELVQNWFDACVDRCGGNRHGIKVITTKAPAGGLAIGADGIIYLAFSGDTFAGYLADYEANDGMRTVELVNYGGMITVDAMVLGVSSKRGQSGATGFFGEGVKVEINRLTASGVKVTYDTPVEGTLSHHAKWEFSYMAEVGGASEVLHLHMEGQDEPVKGVTVRAVGLPRGRPAIDPKMFLFLQGNYTRVSAPPQAGAQVAGIDVLLDKEHEGKIYVGGIFALPWATLKGVGLDYTGGGDSFKHVGLGRDRTSVHVHELIALLPSALAHEKGKEGATLLLKRIYDTLQEYPHSEMAWIRDCPFDGPLTKQARDWWLEFADNMCDLFWSMHGKDAMPCESHEMSLAKEAEGMGANVVVVSFPLKKTLEGSPKCPTMASYRTDFYDAMLKIPDVELDMGDKTHKRIAKIKDGVVRFFSEVRPEQTHFKRPPKGNQRLVVPTDGAFVIDFNLFQLDAVHRAQAAQGHNICLKTDCGCQSLALVRGFTEAIAGADEHRKAQLEQRVMRALLEDNNNKTTKTVRDSESSEEGSDKGSDSDGGGDDMLAMLMGSAVDDSGESGSESEAEEAPKPAVKRGGGGGSAPAAVAAKSSGPSRPQAPRYEADIRGKLSDAATSKLQQLTAQLEKSSASLDAAALPREFVCPLTLEVFSDAALCSDGYTYERAALEIWLSENATSPITQQPIKDKNIFENKTLNDLLKTLKGGSGGPLLPVNTSGSSAAAAPTRSSGEEGGGGGGGYRPAARRSAPSSSSYSSRNARNDDGLDSIYMSRRPAPRTKAAAPKPPSPPRSEEEDGSDEEAGFNEDAFNSWRSSGPPSSSDPAPTSSGSARPKPVASGKSRKSWIFGKKK